jgi:hypothetical protein
MNVEEKWQDEIDDCRIRNDTCDQLSAVSNQLEANSQAQIAR